MLNRASKPFVKLVERYLPDPYIFVLLLTLVTFVLAVVIHNQTPLTTIQQWGDGFWGLLTFSMQMLLVLVTGFMLACTPLVKTLLERLASLAKSAGSAIVLVTLVSLVASWINWGFGLVVGALFAKALARKVRFYCMAWRSSGLCALNDCNAGSFFRSTDWRSWHWRDYFQWV